jgi:L-fuculose-phosphate aldolase
MAAADQAALQADELTVREHVVHTAVAMSRRGLSPGRSGNVSMRWQGCMLITPSGVAYEGLLPVDIVRIDLASGSAIGPGVPSSEAPFHSAAYAARPDMAAIVHTHSLHATVLACAHLSIPAFHYMVAVAGGTDIPCIGYATFGSVALSKLVADGVKNRNACLMANHGMIALGADCAAALSLAAEVEVLSEQYYKVLILGKPNILDASEMAVVLDKFKTYGRA